jgi:hypothetical protein
MVGLDNPLAAPTSFAVDTDRVTLNATATFGSAYEGPPGCVHGGVLAGFFDEMLGMTQTFVGTSGMTGTLTIRYRNPTPLHAEIRFEAWVVGVDGRKINLAGQASHGDTVTAEAAGVFIAVAGDRFVGLAGAAADRAAHRRGVAPPA